MTVPAGSAAAVDQAIALLRPCIEATIADGGISHDRSLVIVVVDPEAARDAPIDQAILRTYAFGQAGAVEVDYARYARDKAQASLREGCDTSILRDRGSALLTTDLPLVGGLHRRGWTIGVSGAVPAFDEAIGVMAIELVHALTTQRPAREGAP